MYFFLFISSSRAPALPPTYVISACAPPHHFCHVTRPDLTWPDLWHVSRDVIRYLRKKPADLSLRETSLLTSQHSDSGAMTSSMLSLLQQQQRKKSWDTLDQSGGASSTSPLVTSPASGSPPATYVGSDGEGRSNKSKFFSIPILKKNVTVFL